MPFARFIGPKRLVEALDFQVQLDVQGVRTKLVNKHLLQVVFVVWQERRREDRREF